MKTIKLKLIIVLIVSVFLTPDSYTQERNVMWVHGLGGSSNSFLTNSEHHQSKYLMKSIRGVYDKGDDAKACSAKIKNQFESGFGNGSSQPTNICISHSFGGLVARTLEKGNADKGQTQNFGGQILVHSPQGGAQFAANYQNGFFDKKFAEVFNKITKPFKADIIDEVEMLIATPLLVIGGTSIDVLTFEDIANILAVFWGINNLEGTEASRLFKAYAENIDFNDKPKITDLVPDSDLMNELRDFDSPGQLITIYGAEERNIVHRLVSSLSVKPGSNTLDIVSDEKDIFSPLEGLFELNFNINRGLGIAADISGANFVRKVFTGHNTPFHERARLWREGKDYLNGGLETDWLILIGAVDFTTIKQVSVVGMTAECNARIDELQLLLDHFHETGEFKNPSEVQQALDNLIKNESCWDKIIIDIKIPYNKPNDGVVLTESQQAAGGILFENINCNHFEAVNTKVMSKNFNDIFQNLSNRSIWYKTPFR
ncbi:MAG TPA: hypothetical protein PKD32_08765 [Saprospiraceae bacterium]|nr:hypothetical protein [Saprospiraceae bacterium]